MSANDSGILYSGHHSPGAKGQEEVVSRSYQAIAGDTNMNGTGNQRSWVTAYSRTVTRICEMSTADDSACGTDRHGRNNELKIGLSSPLDKCRWCWKFESGNCEFGAPGCGEDRVIPVSRRVMYLLTLAAIV